MWPFFSKKADIPTVAIKGNPVHVNVSATSVQAKQRHLARIISCMDATQKEGIGQDRMDSLQAEIRRRIHALGAVGIDVPYDRSSIALLLDRVTNGDSI